MTPFFMSSTLEFVYEYCFYYDKYNYPALLVLPACLVTLSGISHPEYDIVSEENTPAYVSYVIH